MITMINPNNPNGKCFTLDELLQLRQICLENPQIIIMSDEVYTLFTYDGLKLIPIACIPDMYERTVTLNSQGKEFSCTGWRIGTLTGPEYLVEPVSEYMHFQQGGTNTHGQLALSAMLDEAELPYEGQENYWEWANKDF